jgi:hypothetical protein
MVTTNWTKRTGTSTDWNSDREAYLLTEALDFLVTEDNRKIVIEGVGTTAYSGRTEPSTNWTKRT